MDHHRELIEVAVDRPVFVALDNETELVELVVLVELSHKVCLSWWFGDVNETAAAEISHSHSLDDIGRSVICAVGLGKQEKIRLYAPPLDERPVGAPEFPRFLLLANGDEYGSIALLEIEELIKFGPAGLARPWIGAILLVFTYVLMISEVFQKTLVAASAALVAILILTLYGQGPSIATVASWIDSGTIGLLLGMMVIVEILSHTGALEWAATRALRLSGGSMRRLFVSLCLVSGFLSMFLSNATVILLIAPMTMRLCKTVDADPVPFVVGEVLMSNIFGASTLVGDPPNVIVGSNLAEHINFMDFIFNLFPAVILMTIPTLGFLLFFYRDSVRGRRSIPIEDFQRNAVIRDRPLLIKCGVVLLLVLIGFVSNAVVPLDPAWVAIIGAVLLLLLGYRHDPVPVILRVDWDSLLFFSSLFVLIEALSELGVIEALADAVKLLVGLVDPSARLYFAMFLLIWISAFASAILDNIPYTITMLPVVRELSSDPHLALPLRPLVWALVLGADLGGNGTLLGSSANIVGASVAAEHREKITFKSFSKVGFPVVVVTCLCSTLYCFVVYGALGLGVGESLFDFESSLNQ